MTSLDFRLNFAISDLDFISSDLDFIFRSTSRMRFPIFETKFIPTHNAIVKKGNGLGCSICFNDYYPNSKIFILDCEHHYCSECFNQWKYKNSCPMCRKEISLKLLSNVKNKEIKDLFEFKYPLYIINDNFLQLLEKIFVNFMNKKNTLRKKSKSDILLVEYSKN